MTSHLVTDSPAHAHAHPHSHPPISVALVQEKVVVFGGISTSGALLDDVHIYDTRQQRWSGALHRRAASNHAGETIDLLGNHVLHPLVSAAEGDEVPQSPRWHDTLIAPIMPSRKTDTPPRRFNALH